MPRKSKVDQLAEAHEKTMLKAPIFELWVHKHLRHRNNLADYRKAYEKVHAGATEGAAAPLSSSEGEECDD